MSLTDAIHCVREAYLEKKRYKENIVIGGWQGHETSGLKHCALIRRGASPSGETEDLPRVICAALWKRCSRRRIIQVQVISGRERISSPFPSWAVSYEQKPCQ